MRILILGAGGHGQVVADILLAMQASGDDVKPVGFLDDFCPQDKVLGLPVLGTTALAHAIPHDAVIVAIGENAARHQVYNEQIARGATFFTARHPSAIIAPDVKIGQGCVISAGAIVNTGSVIGDNVILNTRCIIEHHNAINDHAHIAPGVHLAGHVTVGSGVLVGVGACAIPNVHIGDGTIIGAGAVVINHIPAQTTAVGVPARVIRLNFPQSTLAEKRDWKTSGLRE